MESRDKNKVAFFCIVLCVAVLCVAIYSRISKKAIKSSIKNAYATVITTQVKDSVEADAILSNIDRFHRIDSLGYPSDVEAIQYIVQDYKRLSKENDSLKRK